MNKFKVKNLEFEYCKQEYNNAYRNERTVEVPLGIHALQLLRQDSLPIYELGAVLPYYIGEAAHHTIVDYYDPWRTCIKQDVSTLDFSGKNVLSISTIEHIGTPDYGNKNLNDKLAFEVMNKIYQQSIKYFVTFPLGLHMQLQTSILQSDIPRFVMKRLNAQNEWLLLDNSNDFSFQYDRPFNNANAICVLTNLKEFYD